jgi:hypothetical protein
MAFDRHGGKLVGLVGFDTDVETWTFDVCTNTWTQMHPDREPPPGTGQLVYDIDSDLTLASDGSRMWAYDLKADSWTEKGLFAPFADQGFPSLRFYDPVSGLVIALGDDDDEDTLGLELWGYEVETDTWSPIQAEPLDVGAHYQDFAYDASGDGLIAYSSTWKPSEDGDWLFGPRTWLFDLRMRTWSGRDAVTPEYSYGMWGIQPAIAYDEAAERTVMVGQGRSSAYDAAADRWEILYETPSEIQPGSCGTRPECRHALQMVYDAVNGRLVVYGGSIYTSAEGWVDIDDLLALDIRTREWTVLLGPSEGQSAPGPE